MAFSPNGIIKLLNCSTLQYGQPHTIMFDSEAEQYNYFNSLVYNNIGSCSYIKTDGSVNVDINYDVLFTVNNVNYVMFNNESGNATDKWVYAFIINKKYVNENITNITFAIDYMQTYLFKHTLSQCFVEREHCNRWWRTGGGTIYPIWNTTPENLEMGTDYKKISYQSGIDDTHYIIACASERLTTSPKSNWYNDIGRPLYFYALPIRNESVYTDGGNNTIITAYGCDELAKNPKIISMFYVHYLQSAMNCLTPIPISLEGYGNVNILEFDFTAYGFSANYAKTVLTKNTLEPPTSFYKNMPASVEYESKLLTSPYKYWQLNDYQALPLKIKAQYLDSYNIIVKCYQTINQQPKTKYYIGSGYKGDYSGLTESIINTSVNDFPLTTDPYLNYLLTNKASLISGIAINAVGAVGGIAGGVATGGMTAMAGAGIAISQASSIAMTMAKLQDLQATPDNVRVAGNNIDFSQVTGAIGIALEEFEIYPEYKQMIYEYFKAYGYKVNRFKTPNIKTRYYYNYVKTIGAVINGVMDNDAMTAIRLLYDNGITFWHYHNGEAFNPYNYEIENVERDLL